MQFGKMMKQMQKMQAEMARIQEELGHEEVEATAGGGMVKAVANGQLRVVRVEIDPSAAGPEDVEILQDMVLAAVNGALEQAQALASQKMGALTGGLGLPGM